MIAATIQMNVVTGARYPAAALGFLPTFWLSPPWGLLADLRPLRGARVVFACGGRGRCAGLLGAVAVLRGLVCGLLRFTSTHQAPPARPLPLEGEEKAGGVHVSGRARLVVVPKQPTTDRSFGLARRPPPLTDTSPPTGGDGPEGVGVRT
ncbi:hypothetical protein Stsp01_50260 [Streptomyces sp. NBRC 13847]|nr:hypothetical protein Stsp01_50260 [Streptomyces sp. NBRC 13847]